ncbi:MAG: hypothetical protein WD208_00075 [Dehalococcoidia bacterium]
MTWYERFKFEQDPYVVVEPSIEHILWNRDDLSDRAALFSFIDRVQQGQRVGLKIWGPAGAGKTWLSRFIEQQLTSDSDAKRLVLRSRTPALSSSPFNAFYHHFLDSFLPNLDYIVHTLNERYSPDATTSEAWQERVRDRNVGACLWTIQHRPSFKPVCLNWLEGERLSANDVRDIGVSSSLNDESKQFSVLRTLVRLATECFDTVTLVVDELENARPAARARALSDAFRELLDTFYGRFSFVACWTVESLDALYDVGFTEFLLRRMEYTVDMEPVSADHAPNWLASVNQSYRSDKWSGADLAPFTEASIRHLIGMMDITQRYPSYILLNCGAVASSLPESQDEIDPEFVDKVRGRGILEYVSTNGLMM